MQKLPIPKSNVDDLRFKRALEVYMMGIKILGIIKIEKILALLVKEILNSPYRREPRAIKKRHNKYKLLSTTRKKSLNQSYSYSQRCGKKQKRGLNATS
jgi:hypothetical protein